MKYKERSVESLKIVKRVELSLERYINVRNVVGFEFIRPLSPPGSGQNGADGDLEEWKGGDCLTDMGYRRGFLVKLRGVFVFLAEEGFIPVRIPFPGRGKSLQP